MEIIAAKLSTQPDIIKRDVEGKIQQGMDNIHKELAVSLAAIDKQLHGWTIDANSKLGQLDNLEDVVRKNIAFLMDKRMQHSRSSSYAATAGSGIPYPQSMVPPHTPQSMVPLRPRGQARPSIQIIKESL